MTSEMKRVNVSFSGGESSGYMCHLLKTHPKYKDLEYKFVFANTGQEHPETIEFVNKCDEFFNLNLIWIEAKVYHGKRKSCGFSITNYEECSQKGEPFEEVVKKYGLPNTTFKLCTRDLKTNPMTAYRKHVGWHDYPTALGMRHDEPKRIKSFFYPLNELEKDKQDVNDFWESQPFRLGIKTHMGNCTWCIEKSIKKLATVYKENPEFFDFPKRLEELYSETGPTPDGTPRKLFRGGLMVKDIAEASKTVGPLKYNEDEGSGCSESCEVFSD